MGYDRFQKFLNIVSKMSDNDVQFLAHACEHVSMQRKNDMLQCDAFIMRYQNMTRKEALMKIKSDPFSRRK